MTNNKAEQKSIFQWGIARKFIVYILLFSSFITLVLTIIQLYMDYRYGIDSIKKGIKQIEESHIDGVINSLWLSDTKLLQIQLNGMLKLSDMQYIDVVYNNETLAKVGKFQNKHVITKEFPLSYTYNNKTLPLGSLRVVYTLEDLYDRLKQKAIVIIISQSIKTFMVSGFIFFIFYMLVARHLHAMATYTKAFNLKTLEQSLVLKRNQNNREKDEFDLLVASINEMRLNLSDSYHQLQKEISERKRSEQLLQTERDNLRNIFESIEDGLYIINQQYNIQYVNPILEKDFGPFENMKCYRYFHDRDDICPWCKNPDVQEGRTVRWEWYSSKNGKTYDLLETPISLPDGSIGKLEIFRDITDRKKTELELKDYREHLEELVEQRTEELKEKTDKIEASRKALTYLVEDVNQAGEELKKVNMEFSAANKELKEFAYIVSHDLKAPLRAISQLTHWISEDYSHVFDDDGREQMALIIKRVKRMDGLIDGILRYSRVGRIREKEESLDLNLLANEVIDTLAVPDHINIIIENKLPVVVRDSIRMKQVFQNLIENAIKFIDTDEGFIKVRCVDEDTSWKFSVSDNGPGIDPRYHEKIFQIFQTLTARDEHESTGIGLTLVKKIIGLYGGSVWVESQTGQGTTFFFTLPKKGEKYEEL
jgi:signal transduction histidine kinase